MVDAGGNTITHEFILVPAAGPYVLQRGVREHCTVLHRGCLGMKAEMEKYRTDRHRIPYKLIGFRFDRKYRKREKIRENPAGTGTETVELVS